MAFEQTWRWFGPKDPITLKAIKQTGAAGIVTALHQIPVGEIWSKDEILKRKQIIEAENFTWSVVESVPVHECIKKQDRGFNVYIENYIETIRNLASCGIDTICYNFMPVLDWSRTDLQVIIEDGAITTKFESVAFAAFDLFILKRVDAEKDYSDKQLDEAKKYFSKLTDLQKENLRQTILLGLPGSLQAYSLEEFKQAINDYKQITTENLRNNLMYFIKQIAPAAKESGVFMAIHPDDPPRSLLGLPRVVGSRTDIEQILNADNSFNNGLTFCTGSLGAGFNNNLVEMAALFSDRINFLHLRNVYRNEAGDFMEAYHLNGEIDLYQIMKILLIEQKNRIKNGRKDIRMPMRPDHGHLMLLEQNTEGIYPGYSLMGRMRGLSELRGLQLGIIRSLGI